MQVLEASKRVLGYEHPDMLLSMSNLALTYKSQDYDEEAIGLISECMRLRQRILGAGHPYTISSLQALNKWQVRQTGSCS